MSIEKAMVSNMWEITAIMEVVLQLHGDFRRRLEPLRVTRLQSGVLLYLQRHRGAKLTEAAAAAGVQPPTVTGVIQDLVRKGWVTRRRAIHDDRALCLRLSLQEQVMARRIKGQVHRCEADMERGNINMLRTGQRVEGDARTRKLGQ